VRENSIHTGNRSVHGRLGFAFAIATSLTAASLGAQTRGGTWAHRSVRDGGAPGDFLGTSVASAGDVDGDGFVDLIAGAIGADPSGRNDAGAAVVYSPIDGRVLHVFAGQGAGDRMGISVAGAGDFDGDGIPDLMVGAHEADPNGRTDAGSVYLYSGADGSLIRRHDGSNSYDSFGRAVANVGDATGDGVPDLVVGAYRADSGALLDNGCSVLLNGATGAVVRTIYGQIDGEGLGWAIAGLGDLDGDGFADFAVSAPFAAGTVGAEAGEVLVISGQTGILLWRVEGEAIAENYGYSLAGVGDTNADGVPDVLVGAPFADPDGRPNAGVARLLSGVDGALLKEFRGNEAWARFGVAVSAAGDHDRDGRADMWIGADEAGFADTGAVSLFSGADGSVLETFVGSTGGDRLGGALASADFTGDGRRDLAAGAYYASPQGRLAAGAVQVWGDFRECLSLTQDTMSALLGGSVAFDFDFPDAEGSQGYALLASLTGVGPTYLGSVIVPLTPDSLFWKMANHNAPNVFLNPYGTLDAFGNGRAELFLPAGLGIAYVGRTLWFAAVSYAPPRTVRVSSIAKGLTILP